MKAPVEILTETARRARKSQRKNQTKPQNQKGGRKSRQQRPLRQVPIKHFLLTFTYLLGLKNRRPNLPHISQKPAAPKTKQPKKPSKTSAPVLTPQSGVHTASPAAVASKKGGEGSVQRSSALTKAEMEILFDLVCGETAWSNAATTLNARPGGSGSKHIASNLKRHWITTLRKRVVDGYVD